jgi:hypothetical protein
MSDEKIEGAASTPRPRESDGSHSNERGIVCCFCGEAWGYVGETPTDELIKEAVDHEKTCPNNPYLKTISEAASIIKRYRNETPLGNQPHMIAHVADAWLSANARVSGAERTENGIVGKEIE